MPDQDFIQLDAAGFQLGYHDNLQGPFYEALPLPDCDIVRDHRFCSPCTAEQARENNKNLIFCAIYMAQSQAGRAAIKTISDHHIKIGYFENFQQQKIPQSGYLQGTPFILVEPNISPELLHIVLIQQAAQFDVSLRLSQVNAVIEPMPRAIEISGICAVMDHADECLENRRANPQRFMPPKLEETMAKLLAMPPIIDLAIPPDRQARSAFRELILAQTVNPNAALRSALGVCATAKSDLEPV